MVPRDLEVPVPRYFQEDDDGMLGIRMDLIDRFYVQHGIAPKPADDGLPKFPEMTQVCVRSVFSHSSETPSCLCFAFVMQLLLCSVAGRILLWQPPRSVYGILCSSSFDIAL